MAFTTIAISKETKRKLDMLKKKFGLRSYEETIEFLIKLYKKKG